MALCSSDQVALKLMQSAVHSHGPSWPPLKTEAHLNGEGGGERGRGRGEGRGRGKEGATNSSKLPWTTTSIPIPPVALPFGNLIS